MVAGNALVQRLAPRSRRPRLRRVRRRLRRPVPPPRAKAVADGQAADPSPARRPPRRLHRRPGTGQADAFGGRDQPLQASLGVEQADRGPGAQGRRGVQEQRPPDRPDRVRQDGAGANPGPPPERPVRHRRRHHADRGGLCRRGRREPDPQARPRGRLRHPAGRAGDHLHRRDRQDRQDQPERVDHPRRLGRRGPAGPAQDARRDRGQRPAPGRAQAPRAGIPASRHQPDPLHLRRDLRRPRRDHRQAAGPEADRLRQRRRDRRQGQGDWSATSSSRR